MSYPSLGHCLGECNVGTRLVDGAEGPEYVDVLLYLVDYTSLDAGAASAADR